MKTTKNGDTIKKVNKKRINNRQKTKFVCTVCGARFVHGRGFIEEHRFPCANERYGWNFCDRVPIKWKPREIAGTPKGD